VKGEERSLTWHHIPVVNRLEGEGDLGFPCLKENWNIQLSIWSRRNDGEGKRKKKLFSGEEDAASRRGWWREKFYQ